MDDRWRAEKRGRNFANIIKLTMIVSILSSIMYNLPILSFLTLYLWEINLAQHINFVLIEKNFSPLQKKQKTFQRYLDSGIDICCGASSMPSGNLRIKKLNEIAPESHKTILSVGISSPATSKAQVFYVLKIYHSIPPSRVEQFHIRKQHKSLTKLIRIQFLENPQKPLLRRKQNFVFRQ